ncbi:hypothetical protein [Pseudoalteromonas sp. T1lg76]|uniref:hypothetical protein n=1 Tax=Pseudoalteromonas sp. T1lg76 TaxID=2077103 RepID=UPI000CF5E724|nr:hypothetical protein [Pseudoalteromonas sp. T1lg76]
MFFGLMSANIRNKVPLAAAMLILIAIALIGIMLAYEPADVEPAASAEVSPPLTPSQARLNETPDLLSPDFIATKGSHCEKYYLIYKQEPSQHNEEVARQVCRNFN